MGVPALGARGCFGRCYDAGMKRWVVFVLVLVVAGLGGCGNALAVRATTDGPEKIGEFQGRYRFLSNFWPATVEFEGMTYPTVEHAYQSAKTLDMGERRRIPWRTWTVLV